MSRADFIVGEANYDALAFVEHWPSWPSRLALLAGPAGSGKSHIAEIWRARSGAKAVRAAALQQADAEALLMGGALAVEDIDQAPQVETALFHLLNLARSHEAFVLLTSRLPATAMPVALPDLSSRLRAATPLSLAGPDDALLRGLLVKLFADRQLTVEPGVVDTLLLRMERSFSAAAVLVERIDRAALAAGRAVTRPLVRDVLGAGDAEEDED